MVAYQLFNQVFEALQLLHEPTTESETRRKADKFLSKDLMRHRECWDIVNDILSNTEHPSQAHFFACNTLRRKITYNFSEIPTESVCQLKNRILQYLVTYAKFDDRWACVVQLAGCLACLYLHWPNWADPVTDIIGVLGQEANTIKCMLQAFIMMAEEASNRKIPVAKTVRDMIKKKLASQAEVVLQVAEEVFQKPGCDNKRKQMVLKAFAAWVQLMTRVPPEKILKCPMFSAAFNSITSADTDIGVFEVGVEAVEGIINVCRRGRYLATLEVTDRPGDAQQWDTLINLIVPSLVQCREAFVTYSKSEDTERAKGLALLFSEVGCLYENQILSGTEGSEALLQLLLFCLSHPVQDVSWNVFGFWMEIGQMSCRMDRESLGKNIPQAYVELIHTLSQVLRYPDTFGDMGSMEKKEVRRYRDDGFTIIDTCCACLPAELFLAEIGKDMQSAQSANDWRKKEVLVTMLGETHKSLGYEYTPVNPQSIKRDLERLPQDQQQVKIQEVEQVEAAKKQKLEQINSTIRAILSELPKLSNENLYKSAVCTTISLYSIRFKNDTDFLKQALEYIWTCLGEKPIEDHVAKAFFKICKDCNQTLLPLLDSLLVFAQRASHLSIDSQCLVMQALCCVGSCVPANEVTKYLEKFLSPSYQNVLVVLKQPQPADHNPQRGSPSPLYQALKVLAEILKHFYPKSCAEAEVHPVVQAFEKMWDSFFHHIFINFKDEFLMEKCTKCIKCVIRTAPKQFIKHSLSTTIITLLAKLYINNPLSCFLYIACIYVDEYGTLPEAQGVLQSVFDHFSKQTLPQLTNLKSFQNNPDQVEDYFELCVKYIKTCPQLLLDGDRLKSVWASALNGIGLSHRESGKAVIKVFAETLALGLPPPNQPAEAGTIKTLVGMMDDFGNELLTRIFNAIADARNDRQYLHFYVDIMHSFWTLDHAKAQSSLQFALARLVHQKTQTPLKPINPTPNEFYRQFVNAQRPEERRIAIMEFQDACDRFLASLEAWEE